MSRRLKKRLEGTNEMGVMENMETARQMEAEKQEGKLLSRFVEKLSPPKKKKKLDREEGGEDFVGPEEINRKPVEPVDMGGPTPSRLDQASPIKKKKMKTLDEAEEEEDLSVIAPAPTT